MKLIKCVINLVTDMNDRLYQMLLCDENAEIQDCAFKHASSRRDKSKCYSNLRRVFFTEVIPRANAAAAGRTPSSALPR